MDRVKDQSFVNVVGGVFPTAAPHLFDDKCDYLCRGEGDEAIPEMMDHISEGKSCKDLLNVWPNPLRDVVDVNTLPITDHTIFP
mgnify:FL=1